MKWEHQNGYGDEGWEVISGLSHGSSYDHGFDGPEMWVLLKRPKGK
jgi:hypothetical protein